MQPICFIKHYSVSNNLDSVSIPQTDLPRLSAAVQHKEKDGIRTTWGKEKGKRSKSTEKVPALNTNASPRGAVLCVWCWILCV